MQDVESFLEGRFSRRMKAEDRYLERLERREQEAETLVGTLTREGKDVYYINLRSFDGTLTGKTKEFDGTFAAVTYLLNKNYV